MTSITSAANNVPRFITSKTDSIKDVLAQKTSISKIDKKIFAEKSKEYADLNEIIQNAKKYINYEKDRSELEKIFVLLNNFFCFI
mgnify:CR=1 FL=1